MSTPREAHMRAVKTVLEGMTGIRRGAGTATWEYLNDPFVELLYTHPERQNRHPYVGVVELEGSQLVWDNRDGSEWDSFEYGIYGQMVKTSGVSAREWVMRLRHDCAATMRLASYSGHALSAIAVDVVCQWVRFGQERYGESEDGTAADFVLPVTARLDYELAAKTD